MKFSLRHLTIGLLILLLAACSQAPLPAIRNRRPGVEAQQRNADRATLRRPKATARPSDARARQKAQSRSIQPKARLKHHY